MYGYTWNLRKYNQMIVVIIVVKIAIMYMRVKTILEIVVIVMTVALQMIVNWMIMPIGLMTVIKYIFIQDIQDILIRTIY